jgi:uncharacterized membrane protein YphA (DoxX/SURF4 family)
VTWFHSSGGLNGDDLARVIGIVMALTIVIGTGIVRGVRIPRAAWPALLWMILTWAAIIATAALAFRHFRPDVL